MGIREYYNYRMGRLIPFASLSVFLNLISSTSSLSSIFTYSLIPCPIYSYLGLPIFLVGSLIISSHWDIQPAVLATVNITVNISLGMPPIR